jgi:hypothetical protein
MKVGSKRFFFNSINKGQKPKDVQIFLGVKRGIFLDFFFFNVQYSTLLHLPPLRFHCVGGCWDRTQDSCDYGIGCQTL